MKISEDCGDDCGDGTGWANGGGAGVDVSEGDNYLADDYDDHTAYMRSRGHGLGTGTGDAISYNSGGGHGITGDHAHDGSGSVQSWLYDVTSHHAILFEIGVPEQLHKFFLPLTPSSMLTLQDFSQAKTQEQRDAILGILELAL